MVFGLTEYSWKKAMYLYINNTVGIYVSAMGYQ